MNKQRVAIVGVSGRAIGMYAMPLSNEFSATAELVALCDISQVHMDYCNQRLPRPVPTYRDFDAMTREVGFDTLIVTTMDRYHHEYIIKGLEAGKDVIVEKPMTIDAEKCRAIVRAEKRSGRRVTVTFNYRFTPPLTALHNLVRGGTIGEVVTVDMHWPLDLSHGADYFRRWHRHRANSGGLQVHKSTHHFDLVNWIIGDEPVLVSAQGGLAFYGKNGPFRSPRCTGCPHRENCRFYWDINAGEQGREFYARSEPETAYVRDGCVFDPSIDIEDHYQAMVKYRKGALLSYSLQAWAPWEGFRLEIQGKQGRVEYLETHGKHDWIDSGDRRIVVLLNDGSRTMHYPPAGIGGHGGGDGRLLQMLFEPGHADPSGHMAGTKAACHSVLVGVAATMSMHDNGRWVSVPDLLKDH